MNALLKDVRLGSRMLLKSPGFTALSVLTLALGIGGSTALFSVVNALVLRELPVRDPARLVSLYTTRRDGAWAGISVLQLAELERRQTVFRGMFGRSYPNNSSVDGRGAIWPINLGRVTGEYYSVLGIHPALGRLMAPSDAGVSPGASAPVAVISYAFWQRRYAGDPDVIGKTIFIARKLFTIIGVAPKGFDGEQVGFSLDVTIPITETPGDEGASPAELRCQYGVGRLRDGVTLAQARAQLEAIWPGVRAAAIPSGLSPAEHADAEDAGFQVNAYPANGYSYLRERFAKPLYLLLGISGLILLIACLNLVVLLLARFSPRRHEFAIRLALGAGRWRGIRQSLLESLAISVVGGCLGVALAIFGSRWLVGFWRQIPFNPPTVIHLQPDLRVLVFASAVTLLTGILFGLLPAWLASREMPVTLLHRGLGTSGRDIRRTNKVLMTAQLAVSLVLVTAGGLLTRSLGNIRAVRPGFAPRNVAVMQLQSIAAGNADYGDRYYQNLAQRLSTLPGVRSVAFSQMIPGAGFGGTEPVESGEGNAAVSVAADSNAVSPAFFPTLGIGLVQGRDFTFEDDERSPGVAIISRSLADRLFPAGKALGHFLRAGADGERQSVRIVGVVGDARIRDVRLPTKFAVYFPFLQQPRYWTNVEILASGPLGPLLSLAQRRVDGMAKQYVFDAAPLEAIIDAAVANERAMAFVASFFSALALLIAAAGLAGLLSYAVSQRTREIGLRMAVGAEKADVVRLVVREGMLLVGAGVGIGAAGALAVGKLMRSLLFGIHPTDPATLLGAALLLALVALFACWIPARRATRVDPVAALKYE